MQYAVKKVLEEGRKFLSENQVEPREARLLLAYSMGIMSDVLVRYEKCTEEQYCTFQQAIKRRVEGEPYAYIVGQKEFMRLPFHVNANTLIPREETESLVQQVIMMLREDTKKVHKVLDMCTGSGCIAISLAKYVEHLKVDAVDISEEAIAVAIENAQKNKVDVHFIVSDLFAEVKEMYDGIISNPPYIVSAEIENLQKEVKREPRLALDGGEKGIDFYQKIAKEAKQHLVTNGFLALEIGYDQGTIVPEILAKEGYVAIQVLKDESKKDRVVVARRG